jgi:hypothetical protein
MPIFWLSAPGECYSNLLTFSIPHEGYSNLLTFSIPDEGYSNLLTFSIPDEGYSNHLTQAESQKIGITFIRCYKSKDRNNLHQVLKVKRLKWHSALDEGYSNLLTFSIPDEGYSNLLTFSIPDEGYSNLLTFSTWWRLFQSFDFQHLVKVIPILCWKSKDWNNLHQVCWKSKDWNNLHQVLNVKRLE